MIDSVFYVEGVQQGSVVLSNDFVRTAEQIAMSTGISIAGKAGANTPAAISMTPNSAFIRWVNTSARVAPVSSYTFYGDISVRYKQCDFFVINCHLGTPTYYGDMVLLPGNSNPTARPGDGGAKYLNGSLGPENFQWGLHEPYVEDSPIGENLVTDAKIYYDLYNSAPASHGQLEGNLQTVMVPDCVTGQPTSVTDEIITIIGGRISGNHVQCQAKWGDR
jgi:hypothetical protein